MQILKCFKTVVVADAEFIPDVPYCRPVCEVWHELHSGQTKRLWWDQLGDEPPYPVGPDSLFVAYNAQAELGFHLALGWPLPSRVLDLYFEFRYRTSGIWPPRQHRKLLDALSFFGLSGIEAVEKQEMIDLILRGPPWSVEEQQAILEYCESDVRALLQLLPAMASYD
jgi:DNA polymerase I